MLSFEEACRSLTAPGAPLELTTAEIRGREYPVFANAAPDLATAFATAAIERGDQDFLVYEGETWSYADVVAHGHALAAALADDFGIEKGDRVAIAMRNYPEWIVAVVGIATAGAVAVPLNAWWGADELDYGLSDSGAKVAIVDPERLERIAEPVDRGDVRAIVVRGEPAHHAVRYEDAITVGTPPPVVPIEPDDDATIMYTSGTTGAAKGAVHTHRNHCQAVMAFACRALVGNALAKDRAASTGTTLPPGPGRVCMILAVPLFHITGFVPVMLSSFFHGHKLVMMYKWDARRALEHIEAEGVTNFVGVPTMVQDLLECPDFETFDTSSLRQVGGGGAPASPELVRRVESSFSSGRPGLGYGMTETTAYGPQNSAEDYVARPTSTGRPVPVMQLRVVDEHGEEVPRGEQGEICFYGPTVIRAYWNKPEATAEAFHDGWLRSGDLGRIDEDGFVYIEDRAKDMVIRGGENVGCIEVEAAISDHPSVYEVAVFGLPHERLGEEVACAVYLKEGATLTPAELTEFVGHRLAAFKVPTVVDIRKEMLPRSAQGKILKRVVRDELAAALGGATP